MILSKLIKRLCTIAQFGTSNFFLCSSIIKKYICIIGSVTFKNIKQSIYNRNIFSPHSVLLLQVKIIFNWYRVLEENWHP